MRPLILVIIAALVIVGGILILSNGDVDVDDQSEGRLVLAITDAAADMQAISEVELTVDSVEVYSATQGWVTVSNTNETYDLLELNASGEAKVFADVMVPADTYSRVRVTLDEVTVVATDETETNARLLVESLEFNSQVQVQAETDAVVTLDFLADQSLHVASEAEEDEDAYVFAAVVAVEARTNAQASVNSSTEVVTTTGGSVTSSLTIGADVDGSTKLNFRLPANAEVEINDEGNIVVDGVVAATSSVIIDLNGGAAGTIEENATGSGDFIDADLDGSGGVEVEL